LMAHDGVVALLVAMQGDARGTRLCWCGDFHRQGKLTPHGNRGCWPGQRGGRLGGTRQGEPHGSPTRRDVGSPTAGCGRYPNLSNKRRGAAPLCGRMALHITRQLLKMRFPKLVRGTPSIGGKEAREQMAAKASPRLFRPWGARPGRWVTTILPLAPPSSLIEPTPALTAHRALSWVGGEARAPLASSRPAVPPSPLRGSAAAESTPPLHWGEAASSLGDGTSAMAIEAK
jgi:hypothetical protein